MIRIARPVTNGSSILVRFDDPRAFGLDMDGAGDVLMFTDGDYDTVDDSGLPVYIYYHVVIDTNALSDMVHKGLGGVTHISIPDLGLEGELSVTGDIMTFDGTSYKILPQATSIYEYVM